MTDDNHAYTFTRPASIRNLGRILDYLKEHGPANAKMISEAVHICQRYVYDYMAHLTGGEVEQRQAHIKKWGKLPGHGFGAIYAYGPRWNAGRPPPRNLYDIQEESRKRRMKLDPVGAGISNDKKNARRRQLRREKQMRAAGVITKAALPSRINRQET